MATLELNPRASVFRHAGSIYLFDPFTRTCASMNEAMLTFVSKPDAPDILHALPDQDRKGLAEITEQLRSLGILVESAAANTEDKRTVPDGSASMMHLAIFVTTKCNLRCAYCYANGGDSGKTITREIWRPAMDYFFAELRADAARGPVARKAVNLAIHGGGEATVEFATLKEIVAEFRERARRAGLQPSVGMGTNGTYNDSVHRWIVENDVSVNISLDGPGDIQNRLRPYRSGQPSYDIVERNLQRLVQAGRRVSIRSTITSYALASMEETVELAKQLGLATVHFEPVSLTGRGEKSGVTRPGPEQFAEKFLRCFLLGLTQNVEVRYSGMRCFEPCYQRFCAAAGQNFCVTPDGNITTCYEVLHAEDPAAREFFIGNIDPVQGLVILDQARILRLRQRVAENMESCKGCFLRYHCAGDCPARSFRYSNVDLYSPDPYRCRVADLVNKQLIAWLADGVIEPRDAQQTNVMSLN